MPGRAAARISAVGITTAPGVVHDGMWMSSLMTGNLKNMTVFITQGLVEKNEDVLKRGGYIFLVISGFCLGVFLSTVLSIQFSQHALYAILPVVLGFNIVLYKEKKDIIN